jgi:hypothetical protein
MHQQAYDWVKSARCHAPADWSAVLDLGGRDINGSVRDLFSEATVYRVLDILPGDGVDIVADAATWTPDRTYDVVVCCETFEHARLWPDICGTAFDALCDDGIFVATMAGPGRPPHSAIDGGWTVYDGEWYMNVDPVDLRSVLVSLGFTDVVVDRQPFPADVRCVARRGRDD